MFYWTAAPAPTDDSRHSRSTFGARSIWIISIIHREKKLVIFRCYFERILIILFGSAAVDAAADAEESIKARGKREEIIQLHELWLSAHKFEDFEWRKRESKSQLKTGGEDVFPESNNNRQFDSIGWIVLIKIHNQLYHEYSEFGRFLFSSSAYMFIPLIMHILILIFRLERAHAFVDGIPFRRDLPNRPFLPCADGDRRLCDSQFDY